MTDLLPNNATQMQHSLAKATDRATSLVSITRQLWNPDICPEKFLPWLAWTLQVDVWHNNWPVLLKREVIKTAIATKRIKGTPAGIKQALQAAGYKASVTEWHQMQPPGSPHSFHVDIDGANSVPAEGTTVQQIIAKTKNARSHYTGAVIHRNGAIETRTAVVSTGYRVHHYSLEAA